MTRPTDTSPSSMVTGLRRTVAVGVLIIVPCCSLDQALTLDLTRRQSGAAGNSVVQSTTLASGGTAGAGTPRLATGGNTTSDAGVDASWGGSTASSGGAGGLTSTSATLPPGAKVSPFCHFAWGRRWDSNRKGDDPRGTPLSGSVDFFVAMTGWETQNQLDGGILRMLNAISPASTGSLRGKMPVIYAPIIPLRAKADAQFRDCDPESTTPNLCTHGAEWIRNHRDELRAVYHDYALDLSDYWGTEYPLVWLFEPRFSDYIRSSQTAPLSLPELSTVASDLIGAVRSRLKNALIGHHASPDTPSLSEYFGALDLSLVDLVYVSGAATSPRFGVPSQDLGEEATYSNLHATTGLPIFVDTGFGSSAIPNHGWLSSDAGPINERIKEGVIAAHVDPPPDDMDQRVDSLRPRVNDPYCGR